MLKKENTSRKPGFFSANRSFLYKLGTIAILLCFALKMLYSCSYSCSAAPVKPVKRSFPKEKAEAASRSYIERNQVIIQRFEIRLKQAGDRYFDQAHNNTDKFVNDVSGFKSCAVLCCKMAKDKVKGTNSVAECLNPVIEKEILYPLCQGRNEMLQCYQNFINDLRRSEQIYRSELKKIIMQEKFKDSGFNADSMIEEAIPELNEQIQQLAVEKTFAAISVALEAACIKFTIETLKACIMPIAKRIATSASVGAICAVADGPLPIGDAICLVLNLGSIGWSCYDIYKVCNVIPQEMRGKLNGLIDDYQRNLQSELKSQASKLVNKCNNNVI